MMAAYGVNKLNEVAIVDEITTSCFHLHCSMPTIILGPNYKVTEVGGCTANEMSEDMWKREEW